MQGAGKKASLLLTGAAACLLLAACHGGSSSTASTVPPTVGTFTCPQNTSAPTTTAGVAVVCTSTGAASADGAGVTYNWNFGDQSLVSSTQAVTGNGITHYYAQPGVYQVTLQVVDDHGTAASRIITVPITVAQATQAKVTPDGVQLWAWDNGSKTANAFGVYQTQFSASPLNQPGARQSGSSWADAQGNLWMFGGIGYDSAGTAGYLNDLWMYNTTSNQWTWVSGSNHANSAGTFGTVGITASTNVISARTSAAYWTSTDANGIKTFWLFGGSGLDKNGNGSYLNDLWKLNSQTGEATWMAGSGVGNTADVVGAQGVASTTNSPGGRSYAATWVDSNGILWMFGGQTINSAGTGVYNDDLWSYDPNPVDTNLHPNGQKGWILVSAASTATTFSAKGIYGGQVGTTGTPGARVSAQTWADGNGNLYLFGGFGFDTGGALGALNDMWVYNIAGGTWTWLTGAATINATSVYGTTQSTKTSGAANVPGARDGTSGWIDSQGNFWMFGGSGSDSTSTTTANDGGGALNEVWAFNPSSKLWAFMGGVNLAGTAGVFIPTPTTSTPPSAFSAYNSPGSRVWGTSWAVNKSFYLFGGAGVDAVGTSGSLSDLWTIQTTPPTN